MQLVYDIQQQPGRLHGIEFVIYIGRPHVQSDEASKFCKSSQLSHQGPHAILFLDEHLGFPRIFGRCHHEIDDGKQHDSDDRIAEPFPLCKAFFPEFAYR